MATQWKLGCVARVSSSTSQPIRAEAQIHPFFSLTRRRLLFLAIMLATVMIGAASRSISTSPAKAVAPEWSDALPAVADVDAFLEKDWQEARLVPSELAEELIVLRRLSLALRGSIPSLDEIRRFERDTAPRRLERWTVQLIDDRRFADYFAMRLARSLIGVELSTKFYRRRELFTQWLSQNLHANQPFDDLATQMIASQGRWTDTPATNYVTHAFSMEAFDANVLAGRTARFFLGQQIDCAQCHNHPFTEWKQAHFEGLAACFGQLNITMTGIVDDPDKTWEVEDRNTLEKRLVRPGVPFGHEWWPDEGTPREQLAAWVTHPDNRRFDRAVANRVWGLIFGRPYHDPVDNLPDPQTNDGTGPQDLLDILAKDFVEHRRQLKRLAFIVASSRSFRLSSQHPAYETGENATAVENHWAAFPIVRIRPEQLFGAMTQSVTIQTVRHDPSLFARLRKLLRERSLIREYGDLGQSELEASADTISQALMRMNSRFVDELVNAQSHNALRRIGAAAPTAADALDTAFLCCLSRRPTASEREYFLKSTDGGRDAQSRSQLLEDAYWALLNSSEFSWNH